MESDLGKLFVGGISWDTDEERLKEYFGNYGEVVEAVIMRDRATGRARGFGFVVFTDPAVAERVTRDKHMIDGRSVEAKKAVPRDDQQHLLNCRGGSGSIPGSPSPGRTKKIFVGGLASNVTESDFKNYFDQFGNITDVVVMYDHNTQRPRGFGFITYDSEEAVDRVLHKSFHDLNGKMVEVKRAVPKELSPATPNNSRSPLSGYNNYNLSRVNNILNSYSPGFNLASLGGYRVRMDGRASPISMVRGAASPFCASGLGLDQGVGPGFTGGSNLVSSLGYGRAASPYKNNGGNSGRYNTPIGYQGENRRTDESQNFHSLWGNGGGIGSTANPINLGNYLGTGSGSFGISYGNGGGGANWGPAPMPLCLGQDGGTGSGYGIGDNSSFGLGGDVGGRNFRSQTSNSFAAPSGNLDDGSSYGGLYRDSSVYGGSNWLSGTAPEMNGPGSFGYGLGSIASDVTARGSDGFVGSYNATGREPNRGVAALGDSCLQITG